MSEPDGDTYTDEAELFDEEGDAMAFGYGLGDGFIRMSPSPETHKSSEQNKYYYYPGYILGYTAKATLLIGLAVTGVGILD